MILYTNSLTINKYIDGNNGIIISSMEFSTINNDFKLIMIDMNTGVKFQTATLESWDILGNKNILFNSKIKKNGEFSKYSFTLDENDCYANIIKMAMLVLPINKSSIDKLSKIKI